MTNKSTIEARNCDYLWNNMGFKFQSFCNLLIRIFNKKKIMNKFMHEIKDFHQKPKLSF